MMWYTFQVDPMKIHQLSKMLIVWCSMVGSKVLGFIPYDTVFVIATFSLQCFDTVGWAAGRASDL